uniref:phytanoyl-CoA dioxygenase family protein n=1 Tax=Pararhizobium sp. IMCC3301 TaxID=3067904 RepID=UPI0027421235|nr:phytanoyl-CoA dioxygenase family protein [Pararhizobium sp. IMCC3301]
MTDHRTKHFYAPRPTAWYTKQDANSEEFLQSLDGETRTDDVPHAFDIQNNIPIYRASDIREVFAVQDGRKSVLAEMAGVLLNGAGTFVIQNAYRDTSVIDAASDIFNRIIAREKNSGGGGDHFAKAGANDRVWNSMQKLCEEDPALFVRYYGNDMIALGCEAWLGPNYKMASQVNLVHPGGDAQEAHRDYHLGFLTSERAAQYPPHLHHMSAALTLQGAVAHCDMSIESGPTKLLPFSQRYGAGYVAYTRPDFRAEFEKRFVQLPLNKGDLLFFSPALYHAAGANRTTDTERMANLLQVSSAFGQPMETIDRTEMCKRIYPVLQKARKNKHLSAEEIEYAVTSAADGYSFPTSLDSDPPVGGLAPQSQKALTLQALEAGWTVARYNKALQAQENRRKS